MKYVRLYKDGTGLQAEKRLLPLDALSIVLLNSATEIYAHSPDGAIKTSLNGAALTQGDVDKLHEAMIEVAGKAYPDNVIDWWPTDGNITTITIV